MKMALLFAGQARHIDVLPTFGRSIHRLIDRYKPDVYCSFWDSAEANKAITVFNPKSYVLGDETQFPQYKQDWWDKWSKPLANALSTEHRRRWFFGEIQDKRSRDNTLRHWVRMTEGMKLIKEAYDLVLITRTDIKLKSGVPEIGPVEPKKMYAPIQSNGSYIDCIFWGEPETMRSMLNWENMISAMSHAERYGKHGRRPQALVRGDKWLAPENTLMSVMQFLKIDHVKQQFRIDLIRG